MTINFDKALGVHPQALILREQRTRVLAANLAHADTPGYKALDFDFQSILKQTLPPTVNLEKTQNGHFSTSELSLTGRMQYRIPYQAALDGNTVEAQVEQAKFAENAVQYQASLHFVNGQVRSLMTAIKGT